MSSKELVYFIRDVGANAIKIGQTSNLAARFQNLKTGTSGELEILGVIIGEVGLESALQEKFRHCKIRNEWYRSEPDLLSFIEKNASPHSQDVRKLSPKSTRVPVDFPDAIMLELDHEARRIGLCRQTLIKMWVVARLDEIKEARQMRSGG
jgi:hypothetical protein